MNKKSANVWNSEGHVRMLVQYCADVLSHVVHTLCECSLDLLYGTGVILIGGENTRVVTLTRAVVSACAGVRDAIYVQGSKE